MINKYPWAKTFEASAAAYDRNSGHKVLHKVAF